MSDKLDKLTNDYLKKSTAEGVAEYILRGNIGFRIVAAQLLGLHPKNLKELPSTQELMGLQKNKK